MRYQKPITITAILIAALISIGYLYTKHVEKNHLAQVEQNWNQTQEKAAKLGLVLDFQKYSQTFLAPPLPPESLTNFPKDFWQENPDRDDILNQFPSLENSYQATINTLKEAFPTTNTETNTDTELLQNILKFIEEKYPDDLKHAQAIHLSSGHRVPDHQDILYQTTTTPLSALNNRLTIRCFCQAILTKDYSETLKQIANLHHFSQTNGYGTLGKVVSMSFESQSSAMLLSTITAPSPSIEFLQTALKILPPTKSHESDSDTFRDEAAFVMMAISSQQGHLITNSKNKSIHQEIQNYFGTLYLSLIFDNNGKERKTISVLDHESAIKNQNTEKISPPARNFVDAYLTLSGKHMLISATQQRSTIDITRLLTATKIHQLTHGQYPNSLTELTPSILPNLPTQPFNNKPYTYTPPKSPNAFPTITGSFQASDSKITVSSQDLLTTND